jgi:predicted lipoprotein with Yx(FWY)xxD motif
VSRSRLAFVGSVLAAGALAVAGCAAAPPPAPAAPPAAAPSAAPGGAQQPGGHGEHGEHQGHESSAPSLWAVQTGSLGVVTTDGSGHLMYRSDADSASPPTSNCTGACAQSWLPVLVTAGEKPQLLGVDPGAIGTITRPEGTTQLTLAGWPLYRDRDDPGGNQSAGRHGQDNTWFVITPTGEKASAG